VILADPATDAKPQVNAMGEVFGTHRTKVTAAAKATGSAARGSRRTGVSSSRLPP
jgi:hypothetical protein